MHSRSNSLRRLLIKWQAKRWLIVLLTGVTLAVAGLRVAYYLDLNTYYSATVSDGAYYYAIGKSLYEDGEILDISRSPVRGPLNAHIGIAFAYSFFVAVFDSPEDVMLHSGWFGLLLFMGSLYLLYLISREIQLNRFSLFFIAIYLAISPLYFQLALNGRTESFFYPLAILWFFVVIKWWKKDFALAPGILVGLFLASFLSYAFRLQALILFVALILTLLFQRKFLQAGVTSVISVLSVYLVISINRLLGGIGMGRGESGHFANIMELSIERIIDFTPVVSHLLYDYDRSPVILTVFFLGLIFLVSHLAYLSLRNRNSILLLSTLITAGSIASIYLFRTSIDTGHLRYIAYALPFLLVGYLYGLKFETNSWLNKYPRYLLSVALVGLSLLTLRHEIVDWQVREDGRRDFFQRNADRFYTIRDIHEQYNVPRYAKHEYTSSETMRVLYSATDQPSNTDYRLEDLEGEVITVIRDEEQLRDKIHTHHSDAQLLHEFRINNEYRMYYIP